MNAPGDDLEESTSWLVWGLYQGSPWYCGWKSKQTPARPECPCTTGTLCSVPSLGGRPVLTADVTAACIPAHVPPPPSWTPASASRQRSCSANPLSASSSFGRCCRSSFLSTALILPPKPSAPPTLPATHHGCLCCPTSCSLLCSINSGCPPGEVTEAGAQEPGQPGSHCLGSSPRASYSRCLSATVTMEVWKVLGTMLGTGQHSVKASCSF